MKRVAEYHVWASLYLEELLHVLTDNFNLALRSLFELVYDQMRIVATEVVEKYWDLKADWALQVTLTVRGADKPARNVIVVMDFWTLRLILYELVTADVEQSGIIIFL